MNLNSIGPAIGAKKQRRRVGRGIGSGLGKTCGKGHKGQKARAGARSTVGFEGGQMPMQRRLPKFGFTSGRALLHQELRLSDLNAVDATVIDFSTLRAAGVIHSNVKSVKLFKSGAITKAITIKGIPMSAGARADILAAGGKVEE